MIRIFYSIAFVVLLPLVLLRLYWRGIKAPAYRQRWQERLGYYSDPDTIIGETLWVHAVSVGEVVAAQPLLEQLLAKSKYSIVITTTTPTGAERLRQLFATQVDKRIFHRYAPYDTPGAVKRFLMRYNPAFCIIMETELWPNAIHYCHQRGTAVVLANGRLSERSARGYQRFSTLTRKMLKQIDSLVVQSASDARRFVELGARLESVTVSGSLKFATLAASGKLKQSSNSAEPFKSIQSSKRLVLVAGSTRNGEEEKVLQAFSLLLQSYSDLLLILVPRHPERFEETCVLCEKHSLNVLKRSDGEPINSATQVLVGDSMGEMTEYYSLATVTFVGGSLVDTGCQNVIEPASLAKAVVTGPSQFNFQTICDEMMANEALLKVEDEAGLAQQVSMLLRDSEMRQRMENSALNYIQKNQQALPQLMKVIEQYLN